MDARPASERPGPWWAPNDRDIEIEPGKKLPRTKLRLDDYMMSYDQALSLKAALALVLPHSTDRPTPIVYRVSAGGRRGSPV